MPLRFSLLEGTGQWTVDRNMFLLNKWLPLRGGRMLMEGIKQGR